jgi:phage shock protein C
MSESPDLTRPRDDRVIAGVCAGLARRFGWPVQRMRIGYALLSLLSAAFPGVAVYLVLWYLMPEDPRARRGFRVREPEP